MAKRWLWMLLFAGCAAVPKMPIVIPTVAYPFDGATLLRGDVQRCAARIADLSAGRFERAAFLRINDEGAFDCMLWPAPFAAHRADWYGATPNGTVAVIHSHPADAPEPSDHDRAEAERIGIPILVVTPGAITMALPAPRMKDGGFSVAYTARDETRRRHHSRPR